MFSIPERETQHGVVEQGELIISLISQERARARGVKETEDVVGERRGFVQLHILQLSSEDPMRSDTEGIQRAKGT